MDEKLKKKLDAKKMYSPKYLETLSKPDYNRIEPKVWTNNDLYYEKKHKLKKTAYGEVLAPRPIKMEALQHELAMKNAKAILDSKKEQLIENSFTFSLSKVHDK